MIGRYNLTWIWTISLMVGRLAGAWSACIDWTLWSGSVVDEPDHECGQNGPDRESPEQSATKGSSEKMLVFFKGGGGFRYF